MNDKYKSIRNIDDYIEVLDSGVFPAQFPELKGEWNDDKLIILQGKHQDQKGDIWDFPIEVIDKMVEYQIEQGNEYDVKVFQQTPCASKCSNGFSWEETAEGSDFWEKVIDYKNFDLFFEKYPKSEYDKEKEEGEMLVDNFFSKIKIQDHSNITIEAEQSKQESKRVDFLKAHQEEQAAEFMEDLLSGLPLKEAEQPKIKYDYDAIKEQISKHDDEAYQEVVNRVFGLEEELQDQGIKVSEGKISYSEVCPVYISMMAKRMMEFKDQYPPDNWKKEVSVKNMIDSVERHLCDLKLLIKGERPVHNQKETALDHLAAIGCDCQIISYQLNRKSE